MGTWPSSKRTIERRLRQSTERLRALRAELPVVDEQLASLAEEAAELSMQALMSDTTGTSAESRRAREHAEAMSRHRLHIVTQIAEIEQRQDALLDRISGSPSP